MMFSNFKAKQEILSAVLFYDILDNLMEGRPAMNDEVSLQIIYLSW